MRATLYCATLLASAGIPGALNAQQGIFVTAGRVLAGSDDEASWRLTAQRDLSGPFGVDVSVMQLPGVRPIQGDLFGAGADLVVYKEGHGLPAVFAGVAIGMGFIEQKRTWASTSIGMRTPLLTTGFVRMMIEGRYRRFTFRGRDGVEIGATLGWRSGKNSRPSQAEAAGLWVPHATTETLRASGIPDVKAKLLNDVISVALDEMGQPYVWGGTGNGSGGFDCSGLIYYAYGKQGISIPRTSAGQALAGVAIRPEVSLLLPGDILTFSERGDSVSHVGLYMGEGRFLHSASNGVRLSRMTDDDTEGKLWLKRWVGVRRIVE